MGASPVTINYSDIQALNLNVPANQGGDDTFNVTSTSAATTIDGGNGDDILNVSSTVASNGSTVLNAPLTFVGGTGSNVVNVLDDGSGDTIVMADGPIQAGQAVAAVVGAGLQLQVNIPVAAVSAVDFNLKTGAGNTAYVLGTQFTTTIQAGSGNSAIYTLRGHE